MEITLFDASGQAIAYIVNDGTIYLWSGEATTYLDGDLLYGWSGRHLGFYQDGMLYDLRGNRVGFERHRCPRVTRVEPVKSVKQVRRVRSVRQTTHTRPVLSLNHREGLLKLLTEGR